MSVYAGALTAGELTTSALTDCPALERCGFTRCTGQRWFITGGAGFIGSHLVDPSAARYQRKRHHHLRSFFLWARVALSAACAGAAFESGSRRRERCSRAAQRHGGARCGDSSGLPDAW